MKKQTVKVIVLGSLIAALIAAASLYYFSAAFPSTPEQDEIADENNEAAEKRADFFNTAKSIEEEFPSNMDEYSVREAIHFMSHQKVKADEKRGALQITPERIDRLMEVVFANQDTYRNADVYLSILNRWKAGDFRNADQDHNTVWQLLDGEVGKATGVLAPYEEEKYIERNFE
ncbi:DUF6241 domain-containing protein [Domibacillus sp. A3M-37]|jgi:hypothetical protein|uniref:DUF6241 domain-containing protein n=1 Tax=Domibacillus TaxID=1433999 RepID=UPI000696A4B7|nr:MULTISPECIES: DUF6241 domain-containing protein [Domibacillus]MCP3762890.1 DUF6241 domain-containing protein [Domibacillus sp. A3M-37]